MSVQIDNSLIEKLNTTDTTVIIDDIISKYSSEPTNTIDTEIDGVKNIEVTDDIISSKVVMGDDTEIPIEDIISSNLAKEADKIKEETARELKETVPTKEVEEKAITEDKYTEFNSKLLNNVDFSEIGSEIYERKQRELEQKGKYCTKEEVETRVKAEKTLTNTFEDLSDAELEDLTSDIEDAISNDGNPFKVLVDGIPTEIKRKDIKLSPTFLSELIKGSFINEHETKYNITKVILSYLGTPPKSIVVREGVLIIDGIQPNINLPITEKDNRILNHIRDNTLACLIDWNYLRINYNNSIQYLEIDRHSYFDNHIREDISLFKTYNLFTQDNKNAIKYMFTLFPKLNDFILQGTTYNRYDGDNILSRKLLNNLGDDRLQEINTRKTAFRNNLGFSLHGISSKVCKWSLNNVATYACNRGKRGFIRYSLGLLGRVGMFGVFGLVNLVVQGLRAGFTPIDELEEDPVDYGFSGFSNEDKPNKKRNKESKS